MKKYILFFILFGFLILSSGCQPLDYDSYDAQAYVDKNLDIEVISITCTGEVGFNGSQAYDLTSDEREICLILGKKDNTEYVYSFGSKENTKLIQYEPSITSTDVLDHFNDLEIDIKHWWYGYLEEIDTMAYYITTEDYSEYFIFSNQDEYQYYTYSVNQELIKISLQELLSLES